MSKDKQQLIDAFLCDLFWLKKLPSKSCSTDLLHLDEFVEFLKLENELISADVKKAFTNWMDVQEARDDYNELGLDSNQVKYMLSTSNDLILPLYIQNCNACLVIRKKNGQPTKVSVFTVHPNNNEIMSIYGDLVSDYPEVTVSVRDDFSMLHSEEFASLLEDLFANEISQIRPKSKKAGSVEDEGRNVVSSVLITEWLVALLDGEPLDEEKVNKKIRNSIEWNTAMYPYRRSGLWLSIKIILQLLLVWKYGQVDGKIYYKALLVKYFIHITEKHYDEIVDEVKLQIISKLAIRLRKLEDLNTSRIKPILDLAFKFISNQRKCLDDKWKIICGSSSKINLSFQEASNKSINIYQQLVESTKMINIFKAVDHYIAEEDENVPKSFNRYFDFSKFSNINQSDGGEESLQELFIIEEWVREYMMTENICTPENLTNLFSKYVSAAKKVYENDPIGFSRMVLTSLNIIRRLIEFAKKKSHIFEEYRTGIDTLIFNFLIITTKDEWKYLLELETYFKNFEKSANFQPDYLLEKVNQNFFSNRYAETNPEMQDLRQKIEQEIQTSIQVKINEVRREKKIYEELIDKANKLPHEYTRNGRRCNRNCSKCYFEKLAREMDVKPYEKVLPEEDHLKNAIVFELLMPDQFRCLSNVLIGFFELVNSYNPSYKIGDCVEIWKNYLSKHNSTVNNRVSLTSSQKPYRRSHYYSQQHHPYWKSEDDFVVRNALNCLISIDSKYVRFSQSNIVDECSFSIDKNGKYNDLTPFLKKFCHNQNNVLSNQSSCHPKLSLTEFIEFGSFRAGYRLQMHNLAKVLSNNLLSFEDQEVFFLIIQSLLQSCPSDNGDWWRETNDAFRDLNFSNEVVLLLEKLLKKIESNWKSINQLAIITFCAKKMLEICENTNFMGKVEKLLLNVRKTCLEWLPKTEQVLLKIIDNPTESANIRNLQTEIASCCCLTFHPFSSKKLLCNFSEWLLARSIIYENLLLNNIGLSSLPQFRKMLLRETIKTSQLIQDSIHESLKDSSELNIFLKGKWSQVRNVQVLDLKWNPYEKSKNWYHTKFDKVLIQVNIVNGALLINQAPIGRLPERVTKRNEYQRIFKNMVLDVQPGSEFKSFITKNTFGGSFFKFKLVSIGTGDEILIISEITKDNKELVYFPYENFGNDIPNLLKENYGHWIDKEYDCILFKPILFLDNNFSKVEYTLNLKSKLLLDIINEKSFIDNRSKIFTEIMKIMDRIEISKYVHAYYQNDTFFVDLPRKGLVFILSNNYSHFICKQFGMTVSTDFEIGTLIGLQKGLKLVDEISKKIVAIIPNGDITVVPNRGHVAVDINLHSISSPPFFTYTINTQLERLEAENSLSSWLFLTYLHGCTSHFLPDPFTNLCGYESALSILKSKRCYQLHIPMKDFESELLELISKLSPQRSYYPKHLTDMQLTVWNNTLSSLVQLDSYVILCDKVLQENNNLFSATRIGKCKYSPMKTNLLYWKAYFKDSNFYSKDCEIDKQSCSSYWMKSHSSDKINLCKKLYHSLSTNKFSLETLNTSKINLLINKIQTYEINLGTIEDWTSLDIKSCFSVLTNEVQKFSTRKLIIFLSMLMYLGFDEKLIYLLGIIYLNKDKTEYPHSERNRNIYAYDLEKCDIQNILDDHKISSSELFPWMTQEICAEYDKTIAVQMLNMCNNLQEIYLKFRNSSSDYIYLDCPYFIKDTYKQRIEALFKEKKENYQLYNYLQQLQTMVNCIPSKPIPHFNTLVNKTQDFSIKPKWSFSIDYSEQLNDSSSNIIELATKIFKTGRVDDNFNIETLFKIIEESIQKIMTPKSNTANQALNDAGLWPRLTKTNILKLLLNENTNQKLKNLIGCYGVLITLRQKTERLQLLKNSKMTTLYSRELENMGHENWKPCEHPYWLILEIEMNIMIRPVQVRVANHMIHSGDNMVMQFNMGEGKSSVIIPMLILELGKNRNQLVRLTVLKALLSSNYQSLRFKLGGILDKPVLVTPFNRDHQVLNCNLLQQLYSSCMQTGGVLLTVPEYRLSFELKCIESIKSKSNYQQLFQVQEWLENNCRDLLDESDEILHVRYQLIYTIGNQLKIDGNDQRWNVLQKVFRSVKKHSKHLSNTFGSSCVELKEMNNFEHSFPHLRILDAKAFEILVENIVDDLLQGTLKGIFISIKSEHRDLFKQFFTREEIDSSTLSLVRQNCKESQWESLLIIRGLLAYGTLQLVLARRWRVNYGIGPTRLIAVPFRAKDIPSERSEYGHPDIAILLTLLSYYYSGLDNSQLEYIFEELFSLDDPEKEYCKWVEEGQNQIPDELKSLSNINLSDYHQKMELVFPFFKYSMPAIDFYLNKCVFPKECKQFPKKLTSSSWNLCNVKNHITSGFSGTKSFLLPTSIQSNELEELENTSKNVESHILKNEEYHVISNEQPCKDIIQSIVHSSNQSKKPTRVLLDVGALMLEMTNQDLAKYWLDISNTNEIHAAIYFNDSDELTVIDRYNHITNFDLSPYKNKLDQCVTYIDDVHTRGTDIKFPETTRAAVTLGNGLSNERFVQACMRMRQLCSENGHTISFWASKEVDSSIKKLSKKNSVCSKEIIKWTHFNTKQMEMDYLLQWAIQGLIYSHKLWLNQESLDKQAYYDKYVEDEVLELQTFYGMERKKELLSKIFKLKELHIRSLHLSNNCKIFESNIEQIIEKLLENNMEIFSQSLNEEQERELENELEEEKQVFRPPKLEPCKPKLDGNLVNLMRGYKLNTYSLLNIKEFLSDTALANFPNIWNGKIYITSSMKNVVISTFDSKIDYYKRLTDWFIHSLDDNYIILICPFEANELFKFINANGKRFNISLNRFSRRIHINDELLYDNLALSIPSTPKLDSMRVENLNTFLPDLFILSCSLYFKNDWEQSIICQFLSLAPKPYNSIETEAYKRGDIDENGKIVFGSRYYRLLYSLNKCDFDPIRLVEKLLSIFDRDDSFQDSHLYMIIRQLQKPFK